MDELKTRTVSIVDDDDAVRDSTRVLLESYGLSVQEYASAPEFLFDALAARERIDCVVLDIHMPKMSGIELLDALNARNVHFPVVVITGRSDPALNERARRSGAFAVFDKPVDNDRLVEAILGALESPPTAP